MKMCWLLCIGNLLATPIRPSHECSRNKPIAWQKQTREIALCSIPVAKHEGQGGDHVGYEEDPERSSGPPQPQGSQNGQETSLRQQAAHKSSVLLPPQCICQELHPCSQRMSQPVPEHTHHLESTVCLGVAARCGIQEEGSLTPGSAGGCLVDTALWRKGQALHGCLQCGA